jgi:hypothetical protein
MYSKKKNVRPVRKKPINWMYVAFMIFCLVMVVGFVVTAIF